jgi:hypothetical protein
MSPTDASERFLCPGYELQAICFQSDSSADRRS